MRMHVMKNTLLSQVSVVKRKHDSNCYPQSSRPSNGRSQRLNVVSIYFAEAPHFTEHKYIPHEIRTICLDFTMWTSHCSAPIPHSCLYVYSMLCIFDIFRAYIQTGYVFHCSRHILDQGIYSIYSTRVCIPHIPIIYFELHIESISHSCSTRAWWFQMVCNGTQWTVSLYNVIWEWVRWWKWRGWWWVHRPLIHITDRLFLGSRCRRRIASSPQLRR